MKQMFVRTLGTALLLALVPTTATQAAPTTAAASTASALNASAITAIAAQNWGKSIPKRFILVDAASAQLFMIENGKIEDSMKVVVGRPDAATPTFSTTVYYATFNPYWYVPPDLSRKLIAPHVVKEGPKYLRAHGYEVVSDFVEDAQPVDPADVNWKAVASGREPVYIRQLPGPENSMGRMKFDLGNQAGVFLHDTPHKDLFAAPERRFSNGCVRLEDAPRLARWLLGRDLSVPTGEPEQHVLLPQPVPVMITYVQPTPGVQMAGLR